MTPLPTVRLFVAIYPPAEAVADVVGQIDRLRIGAAAANGVNVRLADPAYLHVTLAFLGEVEEERQADVTDALTRAVDRWRRYLSSEEAPAGPVRVRLGGGGRFGRGRFTILWTGLTGDVDAVHVLADAVRRELKRSRLPHDWRPFRPHLTLARPGDRIDRADVEADRQTLEGYLGPSWPVTEMVLVRSHPGPRPTYDKLAAWPL